MLKMNDLSVSFGDHKVLDKLNLECLTGELHGILGMNGAGKTTLFRTIYGFKKKDSGECLFENEPANSRKIGFLETENYFYSYMKGKEYLDLLSGTDTKFDIEKWNQIFELPLNDLIDTYSTGMKKKLAFLGVMALDRPILILDEPFNGVDVESNEKIFQILKRLKNHGKTIILSSHILSSLTNICDKISFLKEGAISKTYSRDEFPLLESELREMVEQNINQTLNELL
jgi:ABC-2 type transport system ATP-binding protein